MKTKIIAAIISLGFLTSNAQNKGQFGKGFYRITYMNVDNCKTELQSLNASITEKKLNNLRSYLHSFGAKDRGTEIEFPTFRVYDFSKRSNTEEMLANYSKIQIQEFEKCLKKLKKAEVEKEFQPLKDELLINYNRRLQFEKINSEWYISKNDSVFRKKILEFYSDDYMIATLDKTLALKGLDKMCYTYNELYDIVFSRLFNFERYIHLQNKLLIDYNIDVVIDTCTKS